MSGKDQGNQVPVKAMEDLWNVWYSELHNHNHGLTVKIDRLLESDESEFQRIEVISNPFFGKMLCLYGSLMCADNDNNAYNEMITHVPLLAHPDPKEVLIIGGGDCGALTEVLKHPNVNRCTMCELDSKVVEVSKKHFPDLTSGLKDKRANLMFADGKDFIENSSEKFDIIILDLSDPVGPAADLFQKPFHQAVHDRLNDGGILVAQAESPFLNKEAIKAMHANLVDIFPIVKIYTCFMPIYPSGYWAFLFASKSPEPVNDKIVSRFERINIKTRYYNPETHVAAFALPQFVKEIIA